MSKIHPTAVIAPSARIGADCEVGPYAIIEEDVTLGARNKIYAHAYIGRYTSLGDDNTVHPFAVIGHLPQDLKFDPKTETSTRIGNGNCFREHSSVHRATKAGAATIIGDNGLFMANSHIAHDCVVGSGVVLVNNASITGHCELGDKVIMSGMTGIHQFCRIGRLAMVSALSAANKDLPPFFIYGGRPTVATGINLVGLKRNGVSRESRAELTRAYRILYRAGLPIDEALARISSELGAPEVLELVAFVRASKRGIVYGYSDTEDTLRAKRKTGAARHGGDEAQAEEVEDSGPQDL